MDAILFSARRDMVNVDDAIMKNWGQTPNNLDRCSWGLIAVVAGKFFQPRQKRLQLVMDRREQDRVVDAEITWITRLRTAAITVQGMSGFASFTATGTWRTASPIISKPRIT